MLKTFHFLVVLVVLIAMPAQVRGKEVDFRVWTETDNFKPGIVTVRSTPLRIKEVKFLTPWFATIEARYIYSEDGASGIYIFDLMYFGSDWMFWDQLTAKIGEDVRSLKLIGQPSREQVTLGLQERLRFEVPTDFFEKMTAAPYVDFRVNGKYYYDFFLNSNGTALLRQLWGFVKEHAPELKLQVPSSLGTGGDRQEPGPAPSYIQELRELAKLRDDGIISEAEFQEKKRKLLGLNGESSGGTSIEVPKENGNSENPPSSMPPP